MRLSLLSHGQAKQVVTVAERVNRLGFTLDGTQLEVLSGALIPVTFHHNSLYYIHIHGRLQGGGGGGGDQFYSSFLNSTFTAFNFCLHLPP